MASAEVSAAAGAKARAGASSTPRTQPAGRIDVATVGGILLAVGAIVGGLLLEKGSVADIAQYTAALIVMGGTAGAVMVSTPIHVLKGALRRLRSVFKNQDADPRMVIQELIEYASRARKNGLVSLEPAVAQIGDRFLRKGLGLAVDGTDLQELRRILELEMTLAEHYAESEVKVFESAGGYSPTIGIIGAVMGLIQVMKNLANIDEVGHGIAVAFVATVYGVAAANIFFLPAATKIKSRIQHECHMREMMLEGTLGIAEGLNPRLLEAKLEAFLLEGAPGKPAKSGRP
ncbi:MAG TPA: flagellar motor protein [Bryobacteraceae bacterium]|jgi:chemotaxis protein MotA